MKFKIVSNYDTDLNMFKTINNCFENKTNLTLTHNEDYDYLLIINGYRGKINTTREKVFGLLQEPSSNINYDRNLHYYCSKIVCQSTKMFNNYSGIIEKPVHMFYSNHVNIDKEYFLNYQNFSNRKKICLIVSSIFNPNNSNWFNHNYHKRHNLVRTLLSSDLDFDFYGRGWNNIADSRYKGSFDNKHDILRNYEYSIAIENVNEINYISEKLFDCFLNNTVPLYYGCPNVNNIFNPDSIENIDIEDNNIVEIIKNKIKINSYEYKKAIFQSKQIYFNKFNMFNLMEEMLDERCL